MLYLQELTLLTVHMTVPLSNIRRLAPGWVLLAALCWPRSGAASDNPSAAARASSAAQARFEAGVAAYEGGRYGDAIARFKEADQLSPSPLLSFNIAKVYDRMADNPSALASYRDYLRRLPTAENSIEVRKRIQELEQALRANGVQQVTVLTAPAGASVLVDNVARGVTPWTGELIPGPHTLALRLAGYREAVSEIELPTEHAIDIEVPLVAGAEAADDRSSAPAVASPAPGVPVEAAAPAVPTSTPPVDGLSRAPRWWTWAMFGGSAAALVGAGSFELMRAHLEEQAGETQIQNRAPSKVRVHAGPPDRGARIPRCRCRSGHRRRGVALFRPSGHGSGSLGRRLRLYPDGLLVRRKRTILRYATALIGVIGGLWVGSVAGGCTSDLELSLDDKLCNADDRCLGDYQCNLQTRRCVPRGQLPVGGGGPGGRGGSTGGLGAGPGNGGTGIVGEGGDSAGGRYGNGGESGTAGVAGAGGEQPSDPDAGLDPADADGGCVPTTVYRDDDGDFVGDTSDSQIACPGPGWVTAAGDCRDDIAEVFPGQTEFFRDSYIDAPSAGGVSFDYNCDRTESPEVLEPPPPDCTTILLGLNCTGSGYLPADPPRSGGGSEPRCGSNLRRVCTAGPPACNNDDTEVADNLRFRCR